MPKIKNDLTDVEQHIVLMTLYRDEWKYRNEWFMSVFWRFVYLSLIITFLPNFLVAVNTESKLVSTLPVTIHSRFDGTTNKAEL